MRETSKSRPERELIFRPRGSGIDVGCGDDPLPEATIWWDRGEGDAQYLRSIPDGSLDWLYSSHCLEHMENVGAALNNWIRVVKPGGLLYVVVPDYCLYEGLRWPSRFNSDHKHSFSLDLTSVKVGRTNHWHLDRIKMAADDLGCKLRSYGLQDRGYNYNRGGEDQTLGSALAQIYYLLEKNL